MGCVVVVGFGVAFGVAGVDAGIVSTGGAGGSAGVNGFFAAAFPRGVGYLHCPGILV